MKLLFIPTSSLVYSCHSWLSTSLAPCVLPLPQRSYRPEPAPTIHPTWPLEAGNTCQLLVDAAPTCGTPSVRRTCGLWRRGAGHPSMPLLLSALRLDWREPTATPTWWPPRAGLRSRRPLWSTRWTGARTSSYPGTLRRRWTPQTGLDSIILVRNYFLLVYSLNRWKRLRV